MTRYSAPKISEFPFEMVRLACDRCSRRGQYRRATLIARFGPDTVGPEVLRQIANCTGGITSGQWSACGAYYADLVRSK
jgi:hypothetical protein